MCERDFAFFVNPASRASLDKLNEYEYGLIEKLDPNLTVKTVVPRPRNLKAPQWTVEYQQVTLFPKKPSRWLPFRPKVLLYLINLGDIRLNKSKKTVTHFAELQ